MYGTNFTSRMGNAVNEHVCGLCGSETEATICCDCTKQWSDDLHWLYRIGMPTLRQVAYRQVRLDVAVSRRGNMATAPTPLMMGAEQMYIDVERDLQYMGGLLALHPFGWDKDGKRRMLCDWKTLCPLLIRCMPRLRANVSAVEWSQTCAEDRRKVSEYVERKPERKLVGICPECEPERIPIYSAAGERYVVCPNCSSFLDLVKVREHYMNEAGIMHITRTQAGAARWVMENIGLKVSGRDLKNWRNRGLVNPSHVEGTYWEWNVRELVECVVKMRARG